MKHGCIKCCVETEMPLTREDIERIEKLGFKREYFVRIGRDGVPSLRNKENGLCVFHDGNKCVIYDHRPEGCRLYPLVWSPSLNRATLDVYCPYRYEFSFSREHVERLERLVTKVYGSAASVLSRGRTRRKE
jgi:Fe-S-cluster containining protein